VRFGTISAEDVNLFYRSDSVDDAFKYIINQLTEYVAGQYVRLARGKVKV
jgi:hypothetical protein